jgi:predicted metal-dependent phosphoesterase TrpH
MGLADLHIHSIHSHDGTASIPAILKFAAEKTDLDIIAITDHDNLDGVNQAMDLAPKYGLQVIPGCEISTAQGHLLGLFLRHQIPAGLSLIETLLRIGEQGGMAIAAHPEARGTSSLSFEDIRAALQHPFASHILVGVEAFNGGLVYTRSNIPAVVKSAHLPIAQTGNSDAHILSMIGNGATYFPGTNITDLRIALKQRQTHVASFGNLRGSQVITAYIPQYMLRLLGWTVWNNDPSEPLKYARINNLSPRPSNRMGDFIHQMTS